MKQYVVIGKDGTDDEALSRRMSVRADHLAGAAKLKASGNYVMGGATLDASGKMDGSVMILQFATDEEFQSWYRSEPYIVGKVWENVEVKDFRVAQV